MAALAARGCLAAVVPGAAPDLAAISARTGVKRARPGKFRALYPGDRPECLLAHSRRYRASSPW